MPKTSARSYRIGYLNPWDQAAESAIFPSQQLAAARIGHELVHISDVDQIAEADVDFVLALDPSLPKTTDTPTFGAIHSPRAVLMDYENYWQNLLTYDGYLTIADTLEHFLKALCAGAGKPPHIGCYYLTPQRQFLSCNIERLAAAGALRLCYFGRNWEPRSRPLFRALAQRSYMRIYGPAKAWEYLGGAAYRGAVPFDGQAVQKVYAAFGAGLVGMSRHHTLDDVVSNRIFEIASVGAVAICPDIPWIRRHFADSVYYYNPFGASSTVAQQIDRAMAAIASDAKSAAARGRAARAIFEQKFAAEIMLENAVRYYEKWRERAGTPSDPANDMPIDVIMPVGEHPISAISRALRSIENQTAGRFRVIFVRCRPIDLSEELRANRRRIESFEVVERPGGGRAAVIAKGLAAVRSPFFAVLDGDGFWLSGHVAALLAQIKQCPPERAYVYSGTVSVEAAADGHGPGRERRRIANMVPASGDLHQILPKLAINSFLASASLLRVIDYSEQIADAAADAVLQASLISSGEPVFSYRATACICRGGDGARPNEDLFETFICLHGLADRVERKLRPSGKSEWSWLRDAMQQIIEEKNRVLSGDATRLVLEGNTLVTSLYERDDLERRQFALTPDRVALSGASRFVQHAEAAAVAILPPKDPWSYGARLPLDRADLFSGPQWVVVEFTPLDHPIGIGILNKSGEDFQMRMQAPVSSLPVEAWLHIHDPSDASAVVVQNWDLPARSDALLYKVWVVRETQGGAASGQQGNARLR